MRHADVLARSCLLVLAVLSCTAENPRLCKNNPAACPAGDLRGGDLRGADLRGEDLRGADLRGADLQAADLQGPVDLRPPPDATGCTMDDRCGPSCTRCTGTAQPTCSMGTRCICGMTTDCGTHPKDVCQDGVCQRSCIPLMSDCDNAPAGKVCRAVGLTDHRCGCDNAATDCITNATCTNHVCMCGATVCRAGQTCSVSGVCM